MFNFREQKASLSCLVTRRTKKPSRDFTLPANDPEFNITESIKGF